MRRTFSQSQNDLVLVPTLGIVIDHFLFASSAWAHLFFYKTTAESSRQKVPALFCFALRQFKMASPLSCNAALHGGDVVAPVPQARRGEFPLLTTWPSWLPAFCVGVEEQRVHTYANRASRICLQALDPAVREHRESVWRLKLWHTNSHTRKAGWSNSLCSLTFYIISYMWAQTTDRQ